MRLQRRLVLGLAATAALGALALVPSTALRPKPSKPLFFYLVPLVRVQVTPGPDRFSGGIRFVYRMDGLFLVAPLLLAMQHSGRSGSVWQALLVEIEATVSEARWDGECSQCRSWNPVCYQCQHLMSLSIPEFCNCSGLQCAAELPGALTRITGSPNNIRDNLDAASASESPGQPFDMP